MTLPTWLRQHLTPAPDSAAAFDIRRGKSPWTNGIHLLWSLWIFLTPLFGEGYSSRWGALTLLSYPLFLWLYVKVIVGPRRHGWRYALAMAALSLLLLRWYPSGLSYFVFGCVMLRVSGQRMRFVTYALQLLAMNLVYVAVAAWIGYPSSLWLWVPVMTFVIGTIINVEHASQEKDAALALSQDEVRRLAATAERERIGRDLHDLLGHTLSLITLKLELSRKLFERDPARAKSEMEDAERVAREALAQVRSAVTGIRATDLAAELASAKLLLETTQVQFDYVPPPQGLPPEVERGLALVLREAVTNISRHAQAVQAQVEFVREDNAVQLRIRDNGRGGVSVDGNGLSGMRDRVRELGGSLSVDSPRAGGTRLLIRVPLIWREPLLPLRAVGAVGVLPREAQGHA
ncbi:MAG TPA: sensor histidine kinase [Thermomonas sp.]|jgi:two-component system sensor histidine kinase DesK|nr:sensor histidine kinase [Thermomonas sp.]HRA56357.1 sensor histidine kinase [Thermomonas sp.]